MGMHTWTDAHFGYEHWHDSHFGGDVHWHDSHFGDDSLESIDIGGDPTILSSTDDFGGDTEFGFDPLTLTVLGLGAVGAVAATTHHTLAAHHILASRKLAIERAQAARSRASNRSARQVAGGGATLSDVSSALTEAIHSDPYALGQAL
jgi:hypothetical protein